jgi:hypothetical protein
MGIYFGPEGISTGANEENPKGFWERRDVRNLNDAVLHAVGCDWNRILEFDVERIPQSIVDDFTLHAAKLALEMDAHRPWFIKEPRLCLLLPLWRRVLENPVFIHVYRSPVEVASSLKKRNSIPIEAGLALWEKYVVSAESASRDLPKIIVEHKELVQDPAACVTRLMSELDGHGVRGLRLPSEREISAFVNEDLHREHESRKDLRPYASASQNALFRDLLEGKQPVGPYAELKEKDALALGAYESTLQPMKSLDVSKLRGVVSPLMSERLSYIERKVGVALKESETLGAKYMQEIEKRDRRVGDLEHGLSAARSALAGHAQKIRARYDVKLRLRDERFASLKDDLATLRDLVNTCRANDESRQSRIDQLQDESQDLARCLSEARRQVHATATELADREREIAGQGLEIAGLRLQAKQAGEARVAAEQSIRQRFEEVATLTRLLKAETESKNDELSRLRRREAGQKSRIDTLLDETGNLRRELSRLTGSFSWRLTAPLRAISRLLRRRGGSEARGMSKDADALRRSGMFNDGWYLEKYPDVAKNGQDPALHYLKHGASEGRDPGPDFDTKLYLQTYPDVARSGKNPLLHFLQHGKSEGRVAKRGKKSNE